MEESEKQRSEPERDSLVDRHGFDNVMRGFLAVKPKEDADEKPKKRKPKQKKRRPAGD